MDTREKILDDVARLAGGAVDIIGGAKGQAKDLLLSRLESLLQDLDLVTRKDFETLEVIIRKTREEQDDLKNRILLLEQHIQNTSDNRDNRKT